MNKVKQNYYLVIDKIAYKLYVLKVSIDSDNLPLHTAFFTRSVIEEVYSQLFSLIRERNKIYNQIAYLYIPNDWEDLDYEELLEVFNSNYSDIKLSRDGINLVKYPRFLQ
jgi:hypothetical protein